MFHSFYKYISLIIALIWSVSVLAKDSFTVVIDPGHGGGDVGTPHRKCKQDEKTVALNVALKLGKLIEANHPDVQIVYTRKTDIYPTLPERTQIARKAQGDLFISIHVNAAENSAARGFETYVFGITGLAGKSESEQKRIKQRTMLERENLDINGRQVDFEKDIDLQTKILCQTQREKHNKYSQEVAEYVQGNMIDALMKTSYSSNVVDRGVKAKNIFVLCYSPMPAILVEMGYMSNAAEEKFINEAETQNLLAQSIYKGFTQYKYNWERRKLDSDFVGEPATENNAIKETDASEAAAQASEVTADTQTATVATAAQTEAPKQVVSATQVTAPADAQTIISTTTQAVTKPIQEGKVQVAAQQIATQSTSNDATMLSSMKVSQPMYRIQFMASAKLLKKGDPELRGIWPVAYYQENGLYKYTYGEAVERDGLQNEITKIKQVFKDAFIVRFDTNGQRIR